jgi:protein-S-isoprenylcysteine O-methyltransferase Ste14
VDTWRHIRAILVLPFMGTIVIPGILLFLTGTSGSAYSLSSSWNGVLMLAGFLFVCGGLVLFVTTVRLFVLVGRGTLAPWDPTQKLVVYGVYRHVRNPMISGICCILVGEALLTMSPPILCWLLVFTLGNLIYMPLLEEPGLEKRFGEEYLRYKANVPRWIPRLRAWQG